jgi:hypothetical protein
MLQETGEGAVDWYVIPISDGISQDEYAPCALGFGNGIFLVANSLRADVGMVRIQTVEKRAITHNDQRDFSFFQSFLGRR